MLASATQPTIPEPDRTTRPWLVLAAMALPLLALSMDVNGAGTLLTPIEQDLDVDPAVIGWVVNASALTFAALLLAVGKVAPRWGDRRLVLIGVAGFGAASLVCATAPTYQVLIAGRVGQGIGGVLMFTTSLAVIDRVFDDDRRPAAIGAWGVINGVGGALGPLVGGALTSWWSWRGFFLVAAPFCVVALPIIAALTPPDVRPVPGVAREPIPWGRLVLVGVGVVALIIGVQSWGTGSSSWPTMIGLALAVSCALGLVGLGRRAEALGDPPLLAPGVTTAPWFRPASIVGFCANWGFGVSIVFVGIELQAGRGLDPLAAGLVFSVFSISCALAGLAIGPFTRRLGTARALVVAMASTIVALGAGSLLQVSTPLIVLMVGLAVAGFGQGLAFDVSTLASLEGVPTASAAEASGVLSVVRSIGLTVGVALSSSLAVALDATDRGVALALGLAAVVAVIGTVGTAAMVRRHADRDDNPDAGSYVGSDAGSDVSRGRA